MEHLVFTNFHMYDGRKDSDLVNDQSMVVKLEKDGKLTKGTIEWVGDTSQLNPPAKSITYDLNGKYVIPGLINAHAHLFGDGKPMAALSNVRRLKLLKWFVKSRMGGVIFRRRMKANAITSLHSGVTSMRCAGDPEYYDVMTKEAINAGKFVGPRLITAGKPICITGGHGEIMSHVVDSPWEARKAVRANVRRGSDVIKIMSTGGVMDAKRVGEAGARQMTVEEIEAVCDEAHRAGVKVMAHCESTEGIIEALEGGVDSIDHGAAVPRDYIELFKNNPKSLDGYTRMVPTISAALDLCELGVEVLKIPEMVRINAEMIKDEMIEGLKDSIELDIKLGMGTDCAVPFVPQYEFWKELIYFTHFSGMDPKHALNVATEQNAILLGIDDITGTLVAGKSADFIVSEHNPLEDLSTLEKLQYVVHMGQVIEKPTYKKVKILQQHDEKRFYAQHVRN